jgi:hypothetical protein
VDFSKFHNYPFLVSAPPLWLWTLIEFEKEVNDELRNRVHIIVLTIFMASGMSCSLRCVILHKTNRRVPFRFGFPDASPELQADRLAVGTRLLLMSLSS